MIPTNSPSKKTILCIDGDAAISGGGVLTAPSTRQRLKLATTCKCDVVLLDFEMRGMNGAEVASEIKLVKPELAVILLSGRRVPVRALALVDAFVPKLEASQQLLPMIGDLCSGRQESKHGHESV